jgi:hypothetical protein
MRAWDENIQEHHIMWDMMVHLPCALFLPLHAGRQALSCHAENAARAVTSCCRGAQATLIHCLHAYAGQYLYVEDPNSPRPMLDIVMDKGCEAVLEGLLKVEGTSVNATDDVWPPLPALSCFCCGDDAPARAFPLLFRAHAPTSISLPLPVLLL